MSEGLEIDLPEDDSPKSLRDRVTPVTQIKGMEHIGDPEKQTQKADHLTIVLMMHHSPVGGMTEGAEVRTGFDLKTQEQMYRRRLRLQPGGLRPLDLAWLDESAGYILIENTSKPEKDERPPTIYIDQIQIGPGDISLFKVKQNASIQIEVFYGVASVNLSVFPR